MCCVSLFILLLLLLFTIYYLLSRQMGRQSDRELMMDDDHSESKNKACFADAVGCLQIYCLVGCSLLRECIKLLVNHRRFQQCILLAILINTLSMGIEYHNQVNYGQRKRFTFLLDVFFFIFFPIITNVLVHLTAYNHVNGHFFLSLYFSTRYCVKFKCTYILLQTCAR